MSSLLQYFEYHASLKSQYKKYYVSYRELLELIHSLQSLYEKQTAAIAKSGIDVETIGERLSLLNNNSQPNSINGASYYDTKGVSSRGITIEQDPSSSQIKLMIPTISEDSNVEGKIEATIKQILFMIQHDVDELNTFFLKQLQAFQQLFINLQTKVQKLENSVAFQRQDTKEEVKAKMQQFYREMEFFYAFLNLNKLALTEVFKELEDATNHSYEQFVTIYTTQEPYTENGLLKEMMEKTERLFTDLDGSDIAQAVEFLKAPRTQYKHSDTFKLALNIGIILSIAAMLFIIFVWPPFTMDEMKSSGFFESFPIFRGLFLFILYIWLWGFNLYVWSRNRINHVYIFELDPNNNLDHVKVFKTASYLTLIWAICFLFYVGGTRSNIVSHPIFTTLSTDTFVFAVIFILVGISMLPLHVFHLSARFKVLRLMGSLVTAPFGNAGFAECFAADILTSMVIPIGDTAYLLCYLGVKFKDGSEPTFCSATFVKYAGPLLTFLPYLCRLLQCIRRYRDTRHKDHIFNAAKYCASMTVILLNALHINADQVLEYEWALFRYLWMGAAIFSGLFSFGWDLLKDWGFLQRGSKNFLLRDKLLYKWKWSYYAIIVFNFLGRFAWVGTLSPTFYANQQFLKILFGAIELIRRALWSLFRVEWAIVSNADHFRKYKFVPMPPN